MKYHWIYLIFAFVLLGSCNVKKSTIEESRVTNAGSEVQIESSLLADQLRSAKAQAERVYHASEKRVFDLLHTELDLKFDWKQQHVTGTANLTLVPYFYPTATLMLDAKGFTFKSIQLVQGDSTLTLPYEYDSLQITIQLPKTYQQQDTVILAIDYTARPNDLPKEGGRAITENKGLYFINPLGEDPDKPQQIWTQGETESNSCWFPTIDSPNERMTQEIYLTVANRFQTLSNGILVYSTENGDGTRTDYWRQRQPHAPYLVMLAVGEFAVTKDSWRDLAVHYYVDTTYAQHARAIFGNTPEMMEFFSTRLGVDYPWEKYHQVVVQDFVSGAMENTSAVIHGDFLQRTSRELLDSDNEDVVSHELFHHWFGDLVTCESWANLPLNESFATYGEYLWREYKYGRDKADDLRRQNLNNYLFEARNKQKDMVRFNYQTRDGMFDSHSYDKGGVILHMLRTHVGDAAFFAALQLYLEKHRYTAVEIHQLRLAFEEVTGEDLNWFFNQWFLASGHPSLRFTYEYDQSSKEQTVKVEQLQPTVKTPLYQLPMAIDIYSAQGVVRHEVVVDQAEQTFRFKVDTEPLLVNADAEKALLATKKDEKTMAQWHYQYLNAPLFQDRWEALSQGGMKCATDSLAADIVLKALNDKFWRLRLVAIGLLESTKKAKNDPSIKKNLIQIAQNDPKAAVRVAAIEALSEIAPKKEDPELASLYETALRDSSYRVVGTAVEAIASLDKASGLRLVKGLEGETNSTILIAVAKVYAAHGTDDDNAFFLDARKHFSGISALNFVSAYSDYLRNNRKDATINQGLKMLQEISTQEESWWVRYYGIQAIQSLGDQYGQEERKMVDTIRLMETDGSVESDKMIANSKLDKIKLQQSYIEEILASIKTQEKHENVLRLFEE